MVTVLPEHVEPEEAVVITVAVQVVGQVVGVVQVIPTKSFRW